MVLESSFLSWSLPPLMMVTMPVFSAGSWKPASGP